MPLPTAWHALPHVGAARRQRPGHFTCADPQVRGLLRGGWATHRQTGNRLRAEIQRRILPAFPGDIAQASLARQALGIGVGQRQVPPRPRPPTLVEPAAQTAHAIVLAAIQPGPQSHRTRLETYAPAGNPQSALPNPRRYHECRVQALQTLGKAEPAVKTIMRHYLSRYVY